MVRQAHHERAPSRPFTLSVSKGLASPFEWFESLTTNGPHPARSNGSRASPRTGPIPLVRMVRQAHHEWAPSRPFTLSVSKGLASPFEWSESLTTNGPHPARSNGSRASPRTGPIPLVRMVRQAHHEWAPSRPFTLSVSKGLGSPFEWFESLTTNGPHPVRSNGSRASPRTGWLWMSGHVVRPWTNLS